MDFLVINLKNMDLNIDNYIKIDIKQNIIIDYYNLYLDTSNFHD